MSTDRKATVHALPAETLSDIFILYRNSFPPPSLRWIILTHVCRSWRAVSLSHANLWDVVDIRASAAANEMLARARHAAALYVHLFAPPLTVYDYNSDSDSSADDSTPNPHPLSPPQLAVVALLADPRWRIFDVQVEGNRAPVVKTLRAVAHSSAHMRVLRIVNVNRDPVVVLDAALCGTTFPQLHTLVLYGYCLQLSSPAYAHGLRSLTIDMEEHDWIGDYEVRPEMLLDLLKRLPRLEHLSLRSACSHNQRDIHVTDEDKVISLDRLQSLDFEDVEGDGLWLLERLAVPGDCSMQVEIAWGQNGFDLETELSILDLVFAKSPKWLGLELRMVGDPIQVVCQGNGTIRAVSIWADPSVYFGPLCMRIFPSTSPFIFTLALHDDIHISPDVWQEVAPAVTASFVTICCQNINVGLFPLLCTADSCPRMGSLFVDELDFCAGGVTEPAEEAILQALEKRPSLQVYMRNCENVDDDILKRWKGSVMWTGK